MNRWLSTKIGNMSIRKKFGLVLGIAALAIVTIGGAMTLLTVAQFRQSLVNDLNTLAQLIGNGSQVSLEFGEPTTAEQYLKALELRENIVAAAIYTSEQKKFAEYSKADVDFTELPQFFTDGESVKWESDLLKIYRNINLNGETLGGVYLVSNLNELEAKLSQFTKVSGAIGLVTLLFALFLALKLQKSISDPIFRLTELSKAISGDKDFTLRVEGIETKDEVGILAKNFNTMLAEIQDRDQKIREAMERAEAATKSKSEFLANMSHEIRTPLNNILGTIGMVKDVNAPLTAEHLKYLDMATASSETLLTVINDILDFSKIEAGKLVVDPIEFDLRDHVNKITTPILVRCEKSGIETYTEISDDVPQSLVSDKTRIAQILINLLGNAIKFTEKGGRIGLRITTAKDTEPLNPQTVQFEVWDTGIGIPKDKLSEIFQSFSQADASTTRKYGGTGLGLTISNNLVTLLGGKLWVESEVGKGSSFFFTVSNFDQKESEKTEHLKNSDLSFSETLATLNDLHILVVDDNPLGREIAQHRLNKFGHRVQLAENGKVAIEQWKQNEFDIILMDCQMPVMDGLEATRQIRALEQSREKRTAILAMTANAMDKAAEQCYEAGMDGYVTKPIDEEQLHKAIHQLLTDKCN